MMIFGPFRFGIETMAFQELARSSGYVWAEIERIGASPALQYLGREAETMSLPGVFYPHFKGGLSQLPVMRLAAEQGTPMPLITGYGFYLGLWVIEHIDDTQSVFFVDGVPRKIDFTIQLKQYSSVTDAIRFAISSAIGVISRLFQ
jgi:phage protein U